jgi:hypothetical protein
MMRVVMSVFSFRALAIPVLLTAVILTCSCGGDKSADSDTIAPKVLSTVPALGATLVTVDCNIIINFSEDLDPHSISSSTVHIEPQILGDISYGDRTVVFTPIAPLNWSTLYTVTVSGAVKDVSGNPMGENFVWSFTTHPQDRESPEIIDTRPSNGATDVPVNSLIYITFSEPIDASSLDTTVVRVDQGVTGVLHPASGPTTVICFIPSENLAFGTAYTVTVSAGVSDLAGNRMADHYQFGFTTEAEDLGDRWIVCSTVVNRDLNSVCWSGSVFAAVGDSGTAVTSPDGMNWTVRNTGTEESLYDIEWSGNEFIAIGSQSTILLSGNGEVWEKVSATGLEGLSLRSVTWTGERFAMVAGVSFVLLSDDGATWSTVSTGSNARLFGIASTGTRIVAVGEKGTVVSSPDGSEWDVSILTFFNTYTSVEWAGGVFALIDPPGSYSDGDLEIDKFETCLLTSPTGAVWELCSDWIDYGDGFVWAGSQWVVVGGGCQTFVCDSEPIERMQGLDGVLNDIASTGYRLVAVGSKGLILTTP